MDKIRVPGFAREVLLTLDRAGHQAYLVGGCVRDMLMGRQPGDWDVTTSALPDEVMALFPKTAPTGIRHGTVTVIFSKGNVEVTTFRVESGYADHRRPERVSFVSELREDLARRDFTVNAIALSADGVAADPFGGLEDLKRGVLRCVGDPETRFAEDALRMLRALRFSARLDFTIEENTLAAIRTCAPLVEKLSAERVRDEIEKILLSANPRVLGQALAYGLLRPYAGEWEGDPALLGRLGDVNCHKYARWSAFAAILDRGGAIESPFAFLRALRLDKKTVNAAFMGAELAKGELPGEKSGWKRLLRRYGVPAVTCAAEAAEALGRTGSTRALKAVLSSGECFSLERLAIGGDDLIALGYEPGAQVGDALEGLLLHVIDHPEDNRRSELVALAADGTIHCSHDSGSK